MVRVKLVNVVKRFGEVVAVDHVSIDVEHGELFTLLGPSGCGKTTTLRIIAGLEYPDEGRVYFDDTDVTNLPPYKRNTGMVFQNYALWPHMTVFENVAYGLKIRKLPKEEIRKRVMEVLRLVRLEGLENRYPTQLSGGQQQRVALARALVIEPKVLLLDEPLSNLDAKLRVEMRDEIKRIQRQLGITTIYVTHDQEEAMVLSDRIAIMNNGKIMQIGTPRELYENPRNLFVASFLGKCSIVKGVVDSYTGDGYIVVRVGSKKITGVVPASDLKVKVGGKAIAVLRPHEFSLEPLKEPFNIIEGIVESTSFVSSHVEVKLKFEGQKIIVFLDPEMDVPPGSSLKVYVPCSSVKVFPAEMEEAAYSRELRY